MKTRQIASESMEDELTMPDIIWMDTTLVVGAQTSSL